MSFFQRRYLISLFYLLVATIGVVSWMNIPMELAPDAQLPSLTVTHNWGSTSPEVMEQEVTRKVEQAASRLRDVENINSTTREGFSSVTIRFRRDAPVDFRSIELQEALLTLRETLPSTVVQRPISRAVPSELQAMQTFLVYSLHGDMPRRNLLELAQQRIRLPLMGFDGLSGVQLDGVREPALTVVFDTRQLELLGLRPAEILNQVNRSLNWHSAGFTEISSQRLALLVPPQFTSIQDIEQKRITLPGSQRQLILGDIARVEIRDYPDFQRRRINGNPALTIQFEKEPGADALSLSETIQSRVAQIQAELPEGITLRLEQDNTEQLREQLAELQTQSLYSLLAVFLVLLLFIRRFRAPFIILGSILFSILISISLLQLTGLTINILTLAGLTVAIGMIIDNAVVVFEIVNPGLPEGRDARVRHLREHIRRAVVPVIGSTLTTIGIFIPLIFAMEANRALLMPLGTALSFTLLASVLVSLTWIPYALIWLVPAGIKERVTFKDIRKGGIFRKINLLRIFYWRRRLRWVLVVAVLLAVGIPTFAIPEPIDRPASAETETSFRETTSRWMKSISKPYFDNRTAIDPWIGGISYRFFKQTYFGEPWGFSTGESIFVSINTPQGTPLDEIDKIARNFEVIAEPYTEFFEYFETRVSEQFGARLLFHLKTESLMMPEPYIFYAEAAYLAARTGNSRISVSGLGDSFFSGGGGSVSSSITLRGYSYLELEQTALRLQERLEQNRRVQNVDINQTGFWGRSDMKQYTLQLDDLTIQAKGLDRRSVLDAIQVDINPENTFGRVEFQGQQMYLMGTGPRASTYWMEFQDRPRQYGQTMFTMGEIATLELRDVMSDIRRENQAYTRGISYDFLGPNPMARQFRDDLLATFPLPIGVQVHEPTFWSFGTRESSQNMTLILLMALLSVWMIVSALLEKWLDPLWVIVSVPLALLGVMSGVLFHEMNFSQGAIAGTLLSVGVVVNNAILLMHEKERLRKGGIFGLRSWVYVYRARFRAIIITSLTTIAGLFPLILFGSDPVWTSLAVVVSWGLGFSTILLLLLTGLFGR